MGNSTINLRAVHTAVVRNGNGNRPLLYGVGALIGEGHVVVAKLGGSLDRRFPFLCINWIRGVFVRNVTLRIGSCCKFKARQDIFENFSIHQASVGHTISRDIVQCYIIQHRHIPIEAVGIADLHVDRPVVDGIGTCCTVRPVAGEGHRIVAVGPITGDGIGAGILGAGIDGEGDAEVVICVRHKLVNFTICNLPIGVFNIGNRGSTSIINGRLVTDGNGDGGGVNADFGASHLGHGFFCRTTDNWFSTGAYNIVVKICIIILFC